MSGRSVNLTTLFLGRLRPPKRLTSTSCTYLRHYLTPALLEKAAIVNPGCDRSGIQLSLSVFWAKISRTDPLLSHTFQDLYNAHECHDKHTVERQ